MFRFCKSFVRCLIRLLISELLCLILAFSFALIPQSWARWLSLIFVCLAHCLLMANAGSAAADDDLSVYRREQRQTGLLSPLLLGLLSAFPRCLLYVFLRVFAGSSLMLNLFLLLSAPYIQLHRLILNGTEPFSAVSSVRQILMALPPLFTVLSVWFGYILRYAPRLAEEKAKSHRV